MDLALNNLQSLIWHKTNPPNKQTNKKYPQKYGRRDNLTPYLDYAMFCMNKHNREMEKISPPLSLSQERRQRNQ